MAGMKVAISLPDPVFRAAETLARRLRKSRSQLYAEAIAEYVGARGARALTTAACTRAKYSAASPGGSTSPRSRTRRRLGSTTKPSSEIAGEEGEISRSRRGASAAPGRQPMPPS